MPGGLGGGGLGGVPAGGDNSGGLGSALGGLSKSLGMGNLGPAGQLNLKSNTHDQFSGPKADLGNGVNVKPSTGRKSDYERRNDGEGLAGPGLVVNGTYSPNAVTIHAQNGASDVQAWKAQQNAQSAQHQGSMPA